MKFAAPIMLGLVVCALFTATPARSGGATFTDIGGGLTGLYDASTAWGDYDGDGDLDIAVVGTTIAGRIARIYRNTAGVFADALALPAGAAVSDGALAWGDYDRDGALDLAIAGDTGAGLVTRIYRNTGGTFTDIGAGLEGVNFGALAWGDFDRDGDLDLAVTGSIGAGPVAHLYRNTAGLFADAGAAITPVRFSCLAWSDYDVDGDLDLVVGGFTASSTDLTALYRNSAGVLTSVATALPSLRNGSIDWGDYDNDGDPDVILSCATTAGVWRNTFGGFANSGAVIQNAEYSATVWGDYDNDGRADLAVGGATGSVGFAAIYHNNAGSFADISAVLPNLFDAALAWGDFDNDGDLDLMTAGVDDQGSLFPVHRIYRCTGVPPNTHPTIPASLSVTADATTVTFHWASASDAQTPPPGLSYNLWAGTAPATPNVMSPMANLATGFRRVPQVGNVGQGHQWTLLRSAFTGGNVYWGVQAIDQAFAGSAFASGPSGTLDVGDTPVATRLSLRLAGANPSRSDSRIAYTLPRASRVDLAILDVAGRRVQTLVQGERAAGEQEARWTGEGADGSRSAPGLYLARLSAGGEVVSVRILRIE